MNDNSINSKDLETRLDQLGSLVAEHEEIIEAQRRDIDELESGGKTTPARSELDGESAATAPRNALAAGGLLALLGVSVGTAGAAPRGQVGSSSKPLEALYTEELNGGLTGDQPVSDLRGDGLTLTGDALALDAGDGLTFSGEALAVDLNQVGSGVGVLGGVGTDGIDHRSLTGADGLSITETSGTVTIGVNGTESDVTETFTEGDVTVTTADGGITIQDGALSAKTSTATRKADNTGDSEDTPHGLQFTPNKDLSAITVTVSAMTSGVETVILQDNPQNGSGDYPTTLATKSFPESGNSVTIQHELISGNTYHVFAKGSSLTVRKSNNPSDTYTSNLVDIRRGAYLENDGKLIYDNPPWGFKSIRGIGGPARVEWSEPDSVSRWETATFQAELDGGSVDVFVEIEDLNIGPVWVDWRDAPIGSGTDLSAISSDRVRFRVELIPGEGSSNPRLTNLSRQWRP